MVSPLDLDHETDALYVRVAREIATDHFELQTVLDRYRIDAITWLKMKGSPRFQGLLRGEIEAWEGAGNTHERAKLKAAGLMEAWLEEANQRLYDTREGLNAKVELAKLVTRIAGMGLTGADVQSVGEKLSVTINLGSDGGAGNSLKFEKELTSRVIDGEVNST